MCWVCDHPRASRQDWIDHLREKLAEHFRKSFPQVLTRHDSLQKS